LRPERDVYNALIRYAEPDTEVDFMWSIRYDCAEYRYSGFWLFDGCNIPDHSYVSDYNVNVWP